MEIRDLFVASVALTLGVIMVYSSILNQGWCFHLKVARVIEESKGRDKARTFVGTIGGVLVLVGLYLLLAALAFPMFQSNEDEVNVRASQGMMSFAEGD